MVKHVSFVVELVKACEDRPPSFGPSLVVCVVGPLTHSDTSPRAPTRASTLRLESLSVRYGTRTALEGVTGTFDAGSLTAVVGPNGGGKSTLLKAIKGQVPYQGRIVLENTKVVDIAYLPQHAPIDRSFPLCVADVVGMGLCHGDGFYKDLSCGAKEKIAWALESVNLAGFETRFLHTLSGGQLQKVFFARLTLQNAPLILLDEPFAAVDGHTTQDLMQQVLTWKAQGRTVLIISHDMELVRAHFDTTLILAGRAMGWGPTQDVLTRDAMKAAAAHYRTHEDAPNAHQKRD